MTQREMRLAASAMEREVRAVEDDVRWVRECIEDGHSVPAMLRDAIRLPAHVLARRETRKRFDVLLCDLRAQVGPLGDD